VYLFFIYRRTVTIINIISVNGNIAKGSCCQRGGGESFYFESVYYRLLNDTLYNASFSVVMNREYSSLGYGKVRKCVLFTARVYNCTKRAFHDHPSTSIDSAGIDLESWGSKIDVDVKLKLICCFFT